MTSQTASDILPSHLPGSTLWVPSSQHLGWDTAHYCPQLTAGSSFPHRPYNPCSSYWYVALHSVDSVVVLDKLIVPYIIMGLYYLIYLYGIIMGIYYLIWDNHEAYITLYGIMMGSILPYIWNNHRIILP